MSTGDPTRAAATQPPPGAEDVPLAHGEPVRLVTPAASSSSSKPKDPNAQEPKILVFDRVPLDCSDQAECERRYQSAIRELLLYDRPAHIRAELEEAQRTGVYPLLFGRANARGGEVREVDGDIRGQDRDGESIDSSSEGASLSRGMQSHHSHESDGERDEAASGNVMETGQRGAPKLSLLLDLLLQPLRLETAPDLKYNHSRCI